MVFISSRVRNHGSGSISIVISSCCLLSSGLLILICSCLMTLCSWVKPFWKQGTSVWLHRFQDAVPRRSRTDSQQTCLLIHLSRVSRGSPKAHGLFFLPHPSASWLRDGLPPFLPCEGESQSRGHLTSQSGSHTSLILRHTFFPTVSTFGNRTRPPIPAGLELNEYLAVVFFS